MPHTQGPWETGSRMTRVEVLPNGWNMPMCIADCDAAHAPKLEAEKVANARLIAAAPELLAALKELVYANDTGMGKSAIALRIELAREAITKAEGK